MITRYNSIKSMTKISYFLKIPIFFIFIIVLSSCEALKYKKTKGGEVPVNVQDRVEKNIEEGRGFRLFDKDKKGGTFDFASSNELWRATLDTIDFMPLVSANYSGGIIITDWYSEKNSPNESIKISIRFLTNEIRSDALDIKIFSRKCVDASMNCNVSNLDGNLSTEIKKEILKKAASYKQRKLEESPNKDYVYPDTSGGVF